MAAIGAPGVVSHDVRLEATGSGNGAPPPPRNPSPAATPLLSVSRPSWIVRTESNVRKERKKRPDPPCVVCSGTGRVDCHHCCGRGRIVSIWKCFQKGNGQNGKVPSPVIESHSTSDFQNNFIRETNCFDHICRCRTCGGSGLGYCSRCLGTGEYRYIMGFHFMKREANKDPDQQKNGS